MTAATSNLDHWEHQYVEKIHPKYLNTIAWTDPEAVGRYLDFQWVYDKYALSKKMGVKCWNLEEEKCSYFPVIIKPRYNLWGMGEGAYKASGHEKIGDTKGLIAQEFFEGSHMSTDFVIFNSKVVDHFTFMGHQDLNGSFILWESVAKCPEYAYYLADIVAFEGIGHAILNVETIRGYVIEAHLRPSVQFLDICGRLINQALACFYKDKQYIPRSKQFEKTFSHVARVSTDAIPQAGYTVGKPNGVRSVQHCWEKGLPLSACSQDSYSFRYLVVNGNDIKAIEKCSMNNTESIAFRYI